MKAYGSEAGQDGAEYYRHNDNGGSAEQFRKRRRGTGISTVDGVDQSHGRDWDPSDDGAARRVEAMLQKYHAVQDEITTSISSFNSATLLNRSAQNTTHAGLPRVIDVLEPHSEPSTVPTLPTISDITSTNLTPLNARRSSTSVDQSAIIQNEEQNLQSYNDVARQELNEVTLDQHPEAVWHDNSTEDPNSRASATTRQITPSPQESQKPVNAERGTVEGHDELSCYVSDTRAGVAKRRTSRQGEQMQATTSAQVDELGLDDPIAGLPKERYQPRPSRSRSQRNGEELVVPTDFSKRPEVVARKKGSKRRKTTALATPSPKFGVDEQNEGDNDSVLASFKGLRKRDRVTEPVLEKVHEGAESGEPGPTAEIPKALSIVAVEVPHKNDPSLHERTEQVTSSSPQKKKKRGRPRKRTAENETESTTAPAVTEHETQPDIQHLTKSTTTPQQQTRKKRKADSPPPILPDSAAENDDTANPPSDTEPDTHLSPSEGNSRPKNGAIDDRVSTNTDTTGQLSPPAKVTIPPETPQKEAQDPKKHSPLASGKVAYRVGLSKRARIAPLLKIVKK